MSREDLANFYLSRIAEGWPLLVLFVALSLCASIIGVGYRRTLRERFNGDPKSMDPDGPARSISNDQVAQLRNIDTDGPAHSTWNDDVTRLK